MHKCLLHLIIKRHKLTARNISYLEICRLHDVVSGIYRQVFPTFVCLRILHTFHNGDGSLYQKTHINN
jgi:hypothetical protein